MTTLKDRIGNTGFVCIPYFSNRLFLKLESENPGLSIKDRVAFHVCEQLEQQYGSLQGRHVLEYSSGNLAIGLAQASKVWGFQLTLVITSKTSPDKVALLKQYGVTLIAVDEKIHTEDPTGFRGFAVELSKAIPDIIFVDQFNNPLNPDTHFSHTGPEIMKEFPSVSYIFCAMGTGGTASGIGRYCTQFFPGTKVVGVTPDAGIYYTTFHKIHDQRKIAGLSLIEGVGEDFIPTTLDMSVLHTIVETSDQEALTEVKSLVQHHGVFVGGSSGLAVAAAKKYIREQDLRNTDAVVLCPDSGNRYLSSYSIADQQPVSTLVEEVIVRVRENNEYPKVV